MAHGHTFGHIEAEITSPLPPWSKGGVAPGSRRGCCIVGSTPFLRPKNPTQISSGWSLGWDKSQWMLMRGRKRHAETHWHPVAYIASEKRILLRCMAENGCTPDADGLAFLQTLPDTFQEFLEEQP